MLTRAQIKDIIVSFESDYPVNSWRFNGIHLWPILRIDIFFYLLSKNTSETPNNVLKQSQVVLKKKNTRKDLNKQLKNFIKFVISKLWVFYKIKKVENIFVSHNFHRTKFKQNDFNKFFDSLIHLDKKYEDSFFLEYGSTSYENLYNSDRVFNFIKYLRYYNSFKKNTNSISFEIDGLESFFEDLKKNELINDVQFPFNLETLQLKLKDFSLRVKFFTNILKNSRPKRVYILCYYSFDAMAIVSAANLLDIETIEMQHGPMVDDHLCYGSWSNVPDLGYSVLPRVFWCWDLFSSKAIYKWSSKNSLYSYIIGGNPWINFLKTQSLEFKVADYILYTLQPSPLTLEDTFSDKLITTIKLTKEKWVIRLHPRQGVTIFHIEELLKLKGVLDKVILKDVEEYPLPIVLSNAKVHVTHSSGSTLEALSYKIPSVVINKIGFDYYKDLIQKGKLKFIDFKSENFVEDFLNLIKNN
jgi:hypothetical protein